MQQSKTLADRHLIEDIKKQMQTELQEKTIMDEEKTKLAIRVGNEREVKNQMCKLKNREEEIREQIKFAMENMEEESQEIKKLIIYINDLQSQKPETENWLRITGRESTTDEIVKFEVKVQKQENGKGVEKEIVNNVHEQKQSQDSTQYMQTNTDKIKEGFGTKDTGSDDIQRLSSEIYKTQKNIRLVNLDLDNQAEESHINQDHKDKDGTIEGLLQELKRFQELLKMVQIAIRQREMHLKEEISNMKSRKSTAKIQERKLDQRLEKMMRDGDEFEVLKIKTQKQTEVRRKLAKVKGTIEKVAARTRQKSQDIDIVRKETQEKLKKLEDLSCKIETTKKELEKRHAFISKEITDLLKFNTELRQKEDREFPLESIETLKGDKKRHDRMETDTHMDNMPEKRMGKDIEEMENDITRLILEQEKREKEMKLTLVQKNCEIEKLKESVTEQVKLETESKEIEILKQWIQVERESVIIEREQAEAEAYEINCLRESIKREKQELVDRTKTTKREIREMEILRSELEIKKKESDQIFRRNMQKKWNVIQREKGELRRETKKMRRELDQRLEEIKRERYESEIFWIKLQRQKDEMAEEKQRVKEQTTDKGKAEMDEMVSMKDSIQKQKEGLEIRLEEVKREKREVEALKCELENKITENQQMI